MKHIRVVSIAAAVLAALAVLAPSAEALVPDGAQGWFWQMPQPAGGIPGLSAVAQPDPNDIWAVGAGGLVLHSADAGSTWSPQAAPTSTNLWSVSFPDGRHGWACGGSATGTGSGVILATSDGGATWSDDTPSGFAASLTNVSFVDAEHGWLGTTDGEVLRTTDGGITWAQAKLPSTHKGYLAGYADVDFVDARHGWAGGMEGRIWTTTNGGGTWSRERTGLSRDELVTQLEFTDARHGWALAQSYYLGSSEILATSDGGRVWRRISTPDPWATFLYADRASSVWLLDSSGADPYLSDLSGVGTVTLCHTSDGGRRWSKSSLASPIAVSAMAARGDAVCEVGQGILTSSDGGNVWRPATSGQQYLFTAATALSASDVWAVDASGALLHSTDGSHWVEQPSPSRWANALYGVSFPDKNDGWLVGSSDLWGDGSVILHSSDAGATWTPQASNLSGELVGVDFVDASNGWAISDDNEGFTVGAPLTVEHTTDGGATWLPEYVYDNATLYALDFIDPTTGWVAGEYQPSENSNGLPGIFATTNGGITWSKEKLPVGAPAITGLQFVSANDGWAVGTSYDGEYDYPQQGWVLHTTDGGRSWVRVAGLDDSLVTTVDFSDAQHGWLGGLDGVYATTDGGASWQQVAGGDGVWAIAATDPQHVWAFGEGFLASTVDAGGDTAAPVTLVDHFDAWHRQPFNLSLSPTDLGGAGVQSTAYSTDGGATWQTGTGVAIDAPADHSFDGQHTILYRTTDADGSQEQTESLSIGVDTLGPGCSAQPSVVDAGKTGIIRFMACDATSDVEQATVSIVNAHGKVLRRFVERAGIWGGWGMPYYWLRFKCTLKPGVYRIEVRATDWAGNSQVVIGRNRLTVVRRGAPPAHHPQWPAGLPSSSPGFSSLAAHSLELQRLLRARASLPASAGAPLVARYGRLR